jgi:hypothetical protein
MVTRQDDLTVEFLPNGQIKVSTDAVSQANHALAENFLRVLSELAGGESVRTKRGTAHNHHHGHSHEHDHEGHSH